jgi:hypothetical protein
MTVDVPPARLPVGRVTATGHGNRIGLGVMLGGVFVTVMDNSIVHVAIPSIRTTIGATFGEAALVVAGNNFGVITGAGSATSSASDGCSWPKMSRPSH